MARTTYDIGTEARREGEEGEVLESGVESMMTGKLSTSSSTSRGRRTVAIQRARSRSRAPTRSLTPVINTNLSTGVDFPSSKNANTPSTPSASVPPRLASRSADELVKIESESPAATAFEKTVLAVADLMRLRFA